MFKILYFCYFGLFFHDAFSEFTKSETFKIFNDFDDESIVGPPRTNVQIFDLTPQFKIGEDVVMNTTEFKRDYKSCMFFDYYVNVPENYGLKVVTIHHRTGHTKVYWARYGYNGDVWRRAAVLLDIKVGEHVQFIGNTVSGSISFSQISFETNSKSCEFANFSNDFEGEDSNWNIESIPAGNIEKDLKDHTSNSIHGKVLYLKNGAKIQTKIPIKSGIKCFKFWFNRMIDKKMPTPSNLEVFIDETSVFKANDQFHSGSQWIRAKIGIPFISGKAHSIRIESIIITDLNRKGIILDDFIFSDKDCEDEVNCDFKYSTCGWTNKVFEDHGLTWQLGRGRVMNAHAYLKIKGQTVPNSLETIYTDFTSLRPSSGIEIQSEILSDTVEYCAQFSVLYNRIQIDDVFSLEHIYNGNNFNNRKELWRLNTHLSRTAAEHLYSENITEVSIPSSVFPRRLGFFARSSHPISRMAVNWIKLRKGACHTLPPTPTPKPNFEKSKLEKNILLVADELMKNSLENVKQILTLIKIDDPIKKDCENVHHQLMLAIQNIEANLKV